MEAQLHRVIDVKSSLAGLSRFVDMFIQVLRFLAPCKSEC